MLDQTRETRAYLWVIYRRLSRLQSKGTGVPIAESVAGELAGSQVDVFLVICRVDVTFSGCSRLLKDV